MYKRILFIEDQVDIADIYAQTLGLSGYEVTCSYDGEAGLKEALSKKYDLILLDLMLPYRSGTEILKILRDPAQSPEFDQGTDIFMLTNFDEDDVTKKQILTLAQAYLIKVDITPKLLVGILTDMDEKKQQNGSSPSPQPQLA